MSNTETTETDGGVDGSGSANGSGSGSEDDMFKQILQVVDELYEACQNYSSQNPLDRSEKPTVLYTSALQLLDSIPVENRNSRRQCATYEYLRGKTLDSIPSYDKEAEEHLCKAVKLNPSVGDAWLSLGNCISKRGELMLAKSCIILAFKKGPNKRILCQLSMLEGKIAKDSKVAELGKESIKHAREALAMDVTDGFSWYCLGTALFKSFFTTDAQNLVQLRESLKAYQNAEKDAKMKYHPNLSFYSATINKFLENYERALSGFEAAASAGPCRYPNEEIRNMVELFDTVEFILKAHSHAKLTKNVVSVVKSTLEPELNAVKLNPPYRRATLSTLQEGVNQAFAIIGKIFRLIPNKDRGPRYYFLCDSNFKLCVLSVYCYLANDAIKEEDQVTILNPCYRHQDISWNGKRYVFESLRVDDLKQVLVNGKALPLKQTAQHKPL